MGNPSDPSDRKVPQALLETAMSVGKSKVQGCCGPADVTADPSSDEDGEAMTENPLVVPFHATVLEGTTVLQEWNQVVRNFNVLEGLKEEALQAQQSSLPLDVKRAEQQKLEALHHATQSLSRLAQQDVWEALKVWASAEAGSQESLCDARVLSFFLQCDFSMLFASAQCLQVYHDFITAFAL